MHSLRAQADKEDVFYFHDSGDGKYTDLTLRQMEVTEILVEDGKIKGVKTYSGLLLCKAAVLTTEHI